MPSCFDTFKRCDSSASRVDISQDSNRGVQGVDTIHASLLNSRQQILVRSSNHEVALVWNCVAVYGQRSVDAMSSLLA